MCSRSARSSRPKRGTQEKKKSVEIKAGTCKKTDLQLHTSTFHPTNDAAADEDPVKDSDDSMETLTYSCLLLFGGGGGTDGHRLHGALQTMLGSRHDCKVPEGLQMAPVRPKGNKVLMCSD